MARAYYEDSVLNREGEAVSGATVLVSDPITKLPLTIYSDLTSPNPTTNPLTTDASGRFSFFLSVGQLALLTITYKGASTTLTVAVVDPTASGSGGTGGPHTHLETDVAGLVTDLGAKAAASHTHTEADVANLTTDLARLGSPAVSSVPYDVGPAPYDDGGIFTSLWNSLINPKGITRAPYITAAAQANSYHQTASIKNLSENPPTSFQAQVNATASGGILYLAPGYIYREAVTIGKPLTIIARGAASLRGTDDWSTGGTPGNTWTAGGGTWTSSLTIPSMSTDSVQGSPPDSYSQQHREVVFVDGVGIKLVNATPTAGQWKLGATRTVILGFDPTGHKIEVATRGSVITLTTNSDFVLDGLDIRQCATSGTGPPAMIDSSGITTAKFWIRNCMIGWSHGMGINPGGMTNSNILIENSIFHDCGTVGIAGSSDTNAVFRRNIVFNCGLPLYGWDPGFGSGGIKIAGSNGVDIDSNIAFNNQGVGLWVDVLVTRGVFRNNILWDNYGNGGAQISYEVSSFGVIRDNVIFRTPSQSGGLSAVDLGIFVSNSRWVDIYGNLIMHLPIAVKVAWFTSRTDDPPSGSTDNTHMGGITVHGNKIIGRYHANTISAQPNTSDLGIQYSDDGTGTYTTNVTSNTGGVLPGTSVADGNVYGYPALVNNGASFLEVQQEPDSRWWYDNGGVTQVNTIANWISALSGRLGANSRYMTDADRVAELLKWGLVP